MLVCYSDEECQTFPWGSWVHILALLWKWLRDTGSLFLPTYLKGWRMGGIKQNQAFFYTVTSVLFLRWTLPYTCSSSRWKRIDNLYSRSLYLLKHSYFFISLSYLKKECAHLTCPFSPPHEKLRGELPHYAPCDNSPVQIPFKGTEGTFNLFCKATNLSIGSSLGHKPWTDMNCTFPVHAQS